MRTFLLTVLLVLSGQAHAAGHRKVILISIDGLRGRTLSSLATHHLNTPTLLDFLQHGSVADGLTGVFPTVTYPSHTTLATGVSPAAHGILGNEMFDPEHKTNRAWHWYAHEIQRPALWDRAHEAHLVTGAVGWPVTAGAQIDYVFPEWRPYSNEDNYQIFRMLCTPGLVDEFEKANGPLGPPGEDDNARTAMALFLLKMHHPALLMVHLIDVDHQEHLHGPDSKEAFEALEHVDAIIGKLRAAAPPDTDFVVVSDHGFLPVSQALQPEAILASIGLSAPAGHPDMWRVGTVVNGSSFGLMVRDPKDTDAIRLATETFQQLAHDNHWGIGAVLTGDELKKTRGYTNSFLAVSMKSGYMAGVKEVGPWLTSSGDTLGMHGFLPGDPLLEAGFVAFGPDIPARHLGQHKLVDVAPTVAALLGLPVIPTEGENLLATH